MPPNTPAVVRYDTDRQPLLLPRLLRKTHLAHLKWRWRDRHFSLRCSQADNLSRPSYIYGLSQLDQLK